MGNFIIIVIVSVLVYAAIRYIWKEKKKGAGCVGCPSAGNCLHKQCAKKKKD